MSQIVESDKVGVKTLVLFLLFFNFFAKFIGYRYLSHISPFEEFIDVSIASAAGDLVFLAFLLGIFGRETKQYLRVPKPLVSISYGISLKIILLGLMVPVGYFSVHVNKDFFYDFWGYVDIPIFSYANQLFSMNFKLENSIYFCCITVITPLLEEFLYRVILFRVFRRNYSPAVSVMLVAVLFSVAHPTYFFHFFIFSLVLSFLIHKTGSVWSAIIAHGVYNSLVYTDAYYLGIGSFKQYEMVSSIDSWLVQLYFFPIAIFIVYVFAIRNVNNFREFSRL